MALEKTGPTESHRSLSSINVTVEYASIDGRRSNDNNHCIQRHSHLNMTVVDGC